MQLLFYYEKNINQWVLETFIVLFPSMHGPRTGATGVQYRKHTEYKTAENWPEHDKLQLYCEVN